MFGNYFRSQRKQRGLTLIEAAAQLGMRKSTLAKLETTPAAFSGVRKFVELCTFYQTDPATLLNQHHSQNRTNPMNDNATQLYELIRQSNVPLSTQALAELTGLKYAEISACSNELVEMGIHKTTLGYSLPKVAPETEESLQLRLVRLLAHSAKRLFLANIAEGVQAKEPAIIPILDDLQAKGLIDLRAPGHYHFTEQGLKHIEEHYPQISVPPFVTAKIKAQINDFTIKHSRAKTPLKPLRDINRTIATLTTLASSSAGATKTDLLELIDHLAAQRAIQNQGFQHG